MAWERRRNQRFYYKSVRMGDKVKKIYFGKGPEAELAAMAADQRHRERTERSVARRRQRMDHQQAVAAVDRLSSELDDLVKTWPPLGSASMGASSTRDKEDGMLETSTANQHTEEVKTMLNTMPVAAHHTEESAKGNNMPLPKVGRPQESMADADHQRGGGALDVVNGEPDDHLTPTSAADAMTDNLSPPDQPLPAAEFDFRQLVEQANQGDRDAMTRLRKILDSNPQIWQRVGDLATHARMTLVRLIADGDQLLFESIQRKAACMEVELLGPSPSTLERLSVERVISTWMLVQHADAMAATASGDNVTWARYWSQHQDRAHRRYQSAIKQLGTIRTLMPVSSGVEQVKATTASSGAESVLADPHGREVEGNGHNHGRIDGDSNGHRSPEAVAPNGPKVDPSKCSCESGETDQPRSGNGLPINRILRFRDVSLASTE